MKLLLDKIKDCLEKDKDCVLVTIIANFGPCPRTAGAHMLVVDEGAIYGTIGGGLVEYQAIQQSAEVLKTKTSFSKLYTLPLPDGMEESMQCSDVTVYFQFISSSSHPEAIESCRKALAAIARNEEVWVITDITDESNWQAGIYTPSEGAFNLNIKYIEPFLTPRAMQIKAEGRNFFTEPLNQSGMVYIFGGGHVTQKLVPALQHVGFRYAIFEDRQQFATSDIFPDAEKIILGDYGNINKDIRITPKDYVLVMVSGNKNDYKLLVQILKSPAYYIGILGSEAKFQAFAERLKKEDGFTDKDISRIYSPVGLPILAETPEEIAISITAEMVMRRAVRRKEDNQNN